MGGGPDELGRQIVLRISSKYQIFRIFQQIWVSKPLAWDMSNQVTLFLLKFCYIWVKIGVTWLLVSRARDLETQICQKIMKIWYSKQILRTIWLPSSFGTQKKFELPFFGRKAQLEGVFMYCESARLSVTHETSNWATELPSQI